VDPFSDFSKSSNAGAGGEPLKPWRYDMTIRTTTKAVIFRGPFVLGPFDEELPAGAYHVETDEELLQGISFPVYRRISAQIDLPPEPNHPGRRQTLIIDPEDLEAALKRDQAAVEENSNR
jgi:hypothetical protein